MDGTGGPKTVHTGTLLRAAIKNCSVSGERAERQVWPAGENATAKV